MPIWWKDETLIATVTPDVVDLVIALPVCSHYCIVLLLFQPYYRISDEIYFDFI
jgi:hypothetical protein